MSRAHALRGSLVALVAGAGLWVAAPGDADVIEVPPYTLAPPFGAGPGLGPVADRFTPIDVAAGPPPATLFAPAPPAFDRYACDTFACGGGDRFNPPPTPPATIGVIESPTTPGALPGSLPGLD